MYIDVELEITNQELTPEFDSVYEISDGGYESGYAQGKIDGKAIGYSTGHSDGYAEGESAGYTKGHDDGRAEGFENGYARGRADGFSDGEMKGYADGLAARTYETWTITLVDGSVVEKEVALL